MNLKFIKSGEKKRLLKELDFQFGIAKLPWLLLETGKQKIRGFSGSMTADEIRELSGIANVEIIGAYLFRHEKGGLRISLDGTGIFGEEVKKGIVEISNEEVDDWMKGRNLAREIDKGIYVVKSGNDFFGCCISDGSKIISFVPKERRIRRS